MSQDLSLFYSTATQRGFSRDFQARVSSLVINGSSLTEEDLVYIKNVSIPNKKAAIASVRYFGAEVHSTGTRDFGDSKQWELTFYTDQVLYLKRWFEERLEEVASNVDVRAVNGNPTRRYNANPVPDDSSYATLDIVDDNLEKLVQYKLTGLFVVNAPGINYDLAGTGKVQEFKVTLGYQRWDVTYQSDSQIAYNQSNGSAGGGLTLLGALNQVTNIARGVGNAANAIRYAGRSIRGK